MKGMRRDDALWAAVCFVGGLILIAASAYVHRDTPAYLLAGPLLVACLGVVVRRRAPLAALALGVVAIVGDILVGPSMGTILVFTDNHLRRRPVRPAQAGQVDARHHLGLRRRRRNGRGIHLP